MRKHKSILGFFFAFSAVITGCSSSSNGEIDGVESAAAEALAKAGSRRPTVFHKASRSTQTGSTHLPNVTENPSVYERCEHGAFGIESVTTTTTDHNVDGAWVSNRWDLANGKWTSVKSTAPHSWDPKSETGWWDFERPCAELANTKREELIAERQLSDPHNDLVNIIASGEASMSRHHRAEQALCTVTLTNIPVWNARAAAPCPTLPGTSN